MSILLDHNEGYHFIHYVYIYIYKLYIDNYEIQCSSVELLIKKEDMNTNNTNDLVKYQNKHNHSIDNNLNHLQPTVQNDYDNSLLSCMKHRNIVVILGLPTMITAKVF